MTSPVLDSRCSILGSRFSILDLWIPSSRFAIPVFRDSRFSILDLSVLDSRFSILDSRFWILDRFSIQDPASQAHALDSGLSILGSRFSILDLWILSSRFSISFSGLWIDSRFHTRLEKPCSRFSVLDSPFSILCSRFYIVDSRLLALDPVDRSSIPDPARFSVLDSRSSIALSSILSFCRPGFLVHLQDGPISLVRVCPCVTSRRGKSPCP